MSSRELIALGTSSQVPTRERSHNAYLLRWDGEGFLFDPGEGAQRQLTLAGVGANAIHHICITHFHGDHCLGLAGIVQRLSLDRCDHTVHLYYPESGQDYIDRLCSASIYTPQIEIVQHGIPVSEGMLELCRADVYTLMCHALDHSVPAVGFRIEEPPGIRFVQEKIDQAGIHGPLVGQLARDGAIRIGDRIVHLEEVTIPSKGTTFAFVMDTRPCAGSVALARAADLVVMEATYTSEHRGLAELYGHCTAADAAKTASNAGALRLALAHFSQRYQNPVQHLSEAMEFFPDVIALNDFDRINIPRRAQ